MGKIFTFDEIKNGLVPNPDKFAAAKTQTIDCLRQLVTRGEVVGAIVFGSVAKGSPSERSDFDLLVITPQEPVNNHISEIMISVFNDTNVAIEPIIIPEGLARRGMHTIDESFAIHIKQIPTETNLVGIHPSEVLVPFELPLVRVHEQYLAQKLRRLREGMFARSEVDRQRVLQRALEAPVNTGRRTLQALHRLGATNKTLFDDGKPHVIDLFREVFGNTPLVDDFNLILQQDARYTQLLKDTLNGNVGRDEYDRERNNLTDNAIPTALRWGSEIAIVYARLLEGGKPSVEGNFRYYTDRERF